MKTLIFEGAGWDKADHNGVGNCRIRTTFLNKNGTEIYLEMTGHAPHKHSPSYMKNYTFAGHVSHCFFTKDHKTSYSERLSKIDRMSFEYTKERILGIINSIEIGGDFTDIEVKNSGWSGFSFDGDVRNDFH